MITHRRSAAAALAFAAASLGPPLYAQDTGGDVKCLMASNVFASAATDGKGREAAVRTRFYYLGRVEARLTQAQVKAALAAQGKTFDMAAAATTMNACVQRLDAVARSMQAIGAELSKTAGRQPAPPSTAAGEGR